MDTSSYQFMTKANTRWRYVLNKLEAGLSIVVIHSYVFQISSIYKWSFEPKQIKLNFDGVTDTCSSGNDIIFNFKGFRVFGKVYIALKISMKGKGLVNSILDM